MTLESKQSKKAFLANVAYHADHLLARQTFIQDIKYEYNYPVELDQDLDVLHHAVIYHEKQMLEFALKLSEVCKEKLRK